jgi:hypothetical protein
MAGPTRFFHQLTLDTAMSRKTPRSPDEALAISRALRKKFISPEAEATAKRLLEEQSVQQEEPSEKPFTKDERRRAADILAGIRKKYPPRQ